MKPSPGVLPFDDGPDVDLDDLLEELDAALDASFLGDVKAVFERVATGDGPAPAAA